MGRFPFPPEGKTLAIFELLQYIINEPIGPLHEEKFPEELAEFTRVWYSILHTNGSLLKDPKSRPTPAQLLVSYKCLLIF